MPLRTEMIVTALEALGGSGTAPEICKKIKEIFPAEALGKTPVASIRARLQEACPQSTQFKGYRALFRRISPVESRQGLWGLLEQIDLSTEDPLVQDIIKIYNGGPRIETERKSLIQARVGQGKFRKDLCNIWNNACAVTQVEVPELLRASHIKPWGESDDFERLDANNGLLLIATLDAAFDRKLISFEDDGSMIFSSRLGKKPYLTLGISGASKITKKFTEEQKKYLRYHRALLI